MTKPNGTATKSTQTGTIPHGIIATPRGTATEYFGTVTVHRGIITENK